jgi:hypothetical protein
VAGVEAVDLHALTLGCGNKSGEVSKAIKSHNVYNSIDKASRPRRADDVVSVHVISLLS